ncbi:hypothetical protein DUNSADRAFT_3235 [Dunaliella salina]|uniref:Uncharacterized protein n=1 Tax=Dunaliella salina TaxID=3046 RepID=A0ABQ7FVJ8_DUNSA|nr:hypothetical protein DUNSADRAFT_3235 [Dunaliella salina]|eukprot:KAF5826412.1 hypothetical protein DUNSADRAFT_3235 [Dunaliella salina]
MGPPAPSGPEPAYMKILAPKSGLCPPDFHYAREVWYPHGGFYPDPKHWRRNTLLTLGGCGLILYSAFQWSKTHEERPRAPKIWIPSLMWNENIPDPVDFRGRVLDRRTGKPKDGGGEEH